MPGSNIQPKPVDLVELLDECNSGIIQMPEIPRNWVWDEGERIKPAAPLDFLLYYSLCGGSWAIQRVATGS
jgi:hypothetical protein